jgi:hypothetical protein
VIDEKNNLHYFSKIGRIENLGAGTDLPPPSPYRCVPSTQSSPLSEIVGLPGTLNLN